MPSGTASVGLMNGLIEGSPSAVRWATTVALAPAGRSGESSRMGSEPAAAPAGRTSMSCDPAGRLIGSVTVSNAKFASARLPST